MSQRPSATWQDAADQGGFGLWRVDHDDHLEGSRAFREQLGSDPRDVREWLLAVHPDDRAALHHALRAADHAGARIDVTYRTLRQVPERKLRLTGGRKGATLHGGQSDVTEVRVPAAGAAPARLDALTSLPGREVFIDRLADALRDVQAGVRRAGLLFLDLNGFKRVNDSYGHALGDVLIACIARRLHEALGRNSTLTRYGGDEFAVLIDGDDHALTDAARRVHTAFLAPIDLGAPQVHVDFAIGGVCLAATHHSPAEALDHVEHAVYHAKQARRPATALYDAALHRQREERLGLQQVLASALHGGTLEARYTPLFLDGRFVGAEVHAALPGGEDVDLRGIARGTVYDHALDAWLLAQVARDTHAPGLVRVTLSAQAPESRDAHAQLIAAEQAVRAGGGTLQLVLAAAAWEAHARSTLNALRARGVEITLRDLNALPLEVLASLSADAVLADGTLGPLARAVAQELGWALERAVASGPALTREAFRRFTLAP